MQITSVIAWDIWACLVLIHWDRVKHICATNLGHRWFRWWLVAWRRQAIICTNDGLLLIWPLGTNFVENLIGIYPFSLEKMHLKMSSVRNWPLCLGLNVWSGCRQTWHQYPCCACSPLPDGSRACPVSAFKIACYSICCSHTGKANIIWVKIMQAIDRLDPWFLATWMICSCNESFIRS